MTIKQKTIHRVNDINDLEPITPIEVNKYPGFFYIPDNRDLCISRNGEIIDLNNNKILKVRVNSFNKEYVFSYVPKRQKIRGYQVHRLLAKTFIGRPTRHLDKSTDSLEVNHCDGDRLNRNLNNLEWVTGKENVDHSHLSGFNPRDKPVIAKHMTTGKEKKFNSSKRCADFFKIHRATFWKHLESGNSCKFQKDGFVFKYDDSSDWNTFIPNLCRALGDNNLIKNIVLENLKDQSKIIFNNLKEAAMYLKIPYVTIWRKFKKNNELTINGYKFIVI